MTGLDFLKAFGVALLLMVETLTLPSHASGQTALARPE
jgi:hypothetical protein